MYTDPHIFETESPRRRHLGGRLTGLLAATALTALAASPAGANIPETGLPSIGIEGARQLGDNEMADMRGKYVQPGEVRYFGIDLASAWTTTDGTVLTASLHFGVDIAEDGAATPKLYVSWLQDCDQCNDASVEIPGGGPLNLSFGEGGLVNVSGAVQSNVIAGDDNGVRNDMNLVVTTDLGAINQGPPPGMEITESMMQDLQNGATVQFVLENNTVGMVLANGAPGNVVSQTVGRGDIGQLAQHVNLGSDFNNIHNVMNVTIGAEEMPQMPEVGVNYAMSAMQGNGF